MMHHIKLISIATFFGFALSGCLVVHDQSEDWAGEIPIVGYGGKAVSLDVFGDKKRNQNNPVAGLSPAKQKLYQDIQTIVNEPPKYTADQLVGSYDGGRVKIKKKSDSVVLFSIKGGIIKKGFGGCELNDEPLKIVGNKLISEDIKADMKLYIQDIKLLDDNELRSPGFNAEKFLSEAPPSNYRNDSVWENKGYVSSLFVRIKSPRELESIELMDVFNCGNQAVFAGTYKR